MQGSGWCGGAHYPAVALIILLSMAAFNDPALFASAIAVSSQPHCHHSLRPSACLSIYQHLLCSSSSGLSFYPPSPLPLADIFPMSIMTPPIFPVPSQMTFTSLRHRPCVIAIIIVAWYSTRLTHRHAFAASWAQHRLRYTQVRFHCQCRHYHLP